ncbi:MAG: diguanylate cyclase [Halopseudomonas sabulinigri]
MDYKAYEWRIAFSLVVLLILIQLAGFFSMLQSNRAIAISAVEVELQTASQVVTRLLKLRQQQLAQSTAVLAADYGLRETLSSGDRPTIESMLDNHGKRIGADLGVVRGLEGRLIAKVEPGLDESPDDLDTRRLVSEEGGMHIESADSDGQSAFQFATVPVMTPRPSAQLTMGFAVDEAFVKDLSELNGLGVSVLSRGKEGDWQMLASTLDGDQNNSLAQLLPAQPDEQVLSGQLHGEKYQLLALPLSETQGADLQLVLSVPLQRAMAPYQRIEKVIAALILVGLVLSAFAVQLVIRRLVAPLNAMAHLDSLTGLPNRRVLDMALRQAELARQSRAIPYSLLMIDLDRFKLLNDSFGHAAGDKALQVVAERLLASVNKTDIIARQGGDEFAVLLNCTDQPAAERVANTILQALAAPIDYTGESLDVGGSIGVAVAPPGEPLPARQLMILADKAMYEAKRSAKGFVTTRA